MKNILALNYGEGYYKWQSSLHWVAQDLDIIRRYTIITYYTIVETLCSDTNDNIMVKNVMLSYFVRFTVFICCLFVCLRKVLTYLRFVLAHWVCKGDFVFWKSLLPCWSARITDKHQTSCAITSSSDCIISNPRSGNNLSGLWKVILYFIFSFFQIGSIFQHFMLLSWGIKFIHTRQL